MSRWARDLAGSFHSGRTPRLARRDRAMFGRTPAPMAATTSVASFVESDEVGKVRNKRTSGHAGAALSGARKHSKRYETTRWAASSAVLAPVPVARRSAEQRYMSSSEKDSRSNTALYIVCRGIAGKSTTARPHERGRPRPSGPATPPACQELHTLQPFAQAASHVRSRGADLRGGVHFSLFALLATRSIRSPIANWKSTTWRPRVPLKRSSIRSIALVR